MFMRGRSILARALHAEYSGARALAASAYRDPLVERWAAFRAGAS
jgi:hypothetical protein